MALYIRYNRDSWLMALKKDIIKLMKLPLKTFMIYKFKWAQKTLKNAKQKLLIVKKKNQNNLSL